MVLGGVEMETVFWPHQDQLRVAGTGLVLHTEGGLLEGRIEIMPTAISNVMRQAWTDGVLEAQVSNIKLRGDKSKGSWSESSYMLFDSEFYLRNASGRGEHYREKSWFRKHILEHRDVQYNGNIELDDFRFI